MVRGLQAAVATVVASLSLSLHAQSDITQPGDPIVPTSNNSPGSEGAANAIDNQPTKYLNFDRLNTGFTVTPQVGLTIVSGLTLTSANDAPERDPASFVLSGSYDGTNFTDIASGPVPAFPSRFFKNTIVFDNPVGYFHYRLIFPEVVGPGGNSMQISEVELLGTKAPNGCPVAQGGSIFVNQDSSLSFVLSAQDPEGDSLQFILTQEPAHGTVLVDTQTGAASYTPATNYCGPDSVKFKVNDGACDSAEATVLFGVNCCPTADPQIVAVDQNSQVSFQLQAADADGDPLQYSITQAPAHGTVLVDTQTGAASYTPGTNYCGPDSFKFRVNDGACNSPEVTIPIVVGDPAPPEITNLRVDSPTLWPPNHSMREVTVEYEIRENCPTPTVCFLTVTSNQPIKGTGDGDTAPDWEVLDEHHVRLRAERAGRGGARVYTITVTCMDDSGNSSPQSVDVLVENFRPLDAN
jgi:hypothetical protein